jgi:membrane peptidoglycan carboxypeptidase
VTALCCPFASWRPSMQLAQVENVCRDPDCISFFNARFVSLTVHWKARLRPKTSLAACLVLGVVLWFSAGSLSLQREIASRYAGSRAAPKCDLVEIGRRHHPTNQASCRWTPLSEVSPWLVQSVTMAEDQHFFQHNGIDVGETADALRAYLIGRPRGGASTISQQLARMLFPMPRCIVCRKLKETQIALLMSRSLTKQRTLELYLNRVRWGRQTFGITAAAECYFDAAPSRLTIAQSVFLASLLPAPAQPLVGRNAARATRAQTAVVLRLYRHGLLPADSVARVGSALEALMQSPRTSDCERDTSPSLPWMMKEVLHLRHSAAGVTRRAMEPAHRALVGL